MKAYAGIGSRRTPPLVLAAMETIAAALAEGGWTLRSGHAPGADQAFERGAGGSAEVYLPWVGFEEDVPVLGKTMPYPSTTAHWIAADHHPAWNYLKRGARTLHARNSHQILGLELGDPSAFVLAWTPDGSVDGTGKDGGGTAQALRVATAYGVPVLNLKNRDARRLHTDVMAWVADGCPHA